MPRFTKFIAAALLVFGLAAPALGSTGIRGLEVINGKMYASSAYRLFVVAEQTELPIRSVEVQIDDGAWTTYAGNQLEPWCEGSGCGGADSAASADPAATGQDTTRAGVKTRGTFSIAREGMHTLTTRATDILGNRSRENREIVFIDNTAPEALLQSYYFVDPDYDVASIDPSYIDEQLVEDAESAYQRNGSVYVGPKYAHHLEAFDLRAGVRTIQYRFGTGDAEWITIKRQTQNGSLERDPCEASENVTYVDYAEDVLSMFYTVITNASSQVMQPGWNIMEVRLQDMVYNCSEVMAFSLYYDTYKPEPAVTPEIAFPYIDGEVQNVATVDNSFMVSATDAGSGVAKIQIMLEHGETQDELESSPEPEYPTDPDGEDPWGWHEYIRPINFVEAGFHRIWVRVVDNVGNVNEPYYMDVRVVINPPDTEVRGAEPVRYSD